VAFCEIGQFSVIQGHPSTIGKGVSNASDNAEIRCRRMELADAAG
jgi:hypothetical protein